MNYGPVTGVRRSTRGAFPCSPQHFHAELLSDLYASPDGAATSPFVFAFTVVRDPLSRLRSEFRFQRYLGSRRRRWSQGFVGSFGPSFEAWVNIVLSAYKTNRFLLDNHIRPQNEFLAYDAAVFRIEDGLSKLADDLADVLGGSAVSVPRVNVSDDYKRDSKLVLSPRTMRRVISFYEADYARFGYEVPSR